MMRFLLISFLLFSFQNQAYRYICNGLLADGVEHGDTCGLCNDEFAARWLNPNLPVVVDYSVTPDGITLEEWQAVVKHSFGAWNSIEGTDFRFTPIEAESLRMFGINDSLHEIYWVTDPIEWRILVGEGEFGTLGATLPRYTCGGDLEQNRVIFDADLILNGLDYLKWEVDCGELEDCVSLPTTLVHELGHMLGLDHPCDYCDNSIMSARAGNNLLYPVADDIAGIRALYPSSEQNHGTFAYPCLSDEQCAEGFFCIENQGQQICSNPCIEDQDCEIGGVCNNLNEEESFCGFIDHKLSVGAKLYESCLRVDCIEPLKCVGVNNASFHCFMPCLNGYECMNGTECVHVDDETSICMPLSKIGEECSMVRFCDEDLYCLFDQNSKGKCSKSCSTTEECFVGQECKLVEDKISLCIYSSKGYLDKSLTVDVNNSDGRKSVWTSKIMTCSVVDAYGHFEFVIILFFMSLLQKKRKNL